MSKAIDRYQARRKSWPHDLILVSFAIVRFGTTIQWPSTRFETTANILIMSYCTWWGELLKSMWLVVLLVSVESETKRHQEQNFNEQRSQLDSPLRRTSRCGAVPNPAFEAEQIRLVENDGTKHITPFTGDVSWHRNEKTSSLSDISSICHFSWHFGRYSNMLVQSFEVVGGEIKYDEAWHRELRKSGNVSVTTFPSHRSITSLVCCVRKSTTTSETTKPCCFSWKA